MKITLKEAVEAFHALRTLDGYWADAKTPQGEQTVFKPYVFPFAATFAMARLGAALRLPVEAYLVAAQDLDETDTERVEQKNAELAREIEIPASKIAKRDLDAGKGKNPIPVPTLMALLPVIEGA